MKDGGERKQQLFEHFCWLCLCSVRQVCGFGLSQSLPYLSLRSTGDVCALEEVNDTGSMLMSTLFRICCKDKVFSVYSRCNHPIIKKKDVLLHKTASSCTVHYEKSIESKKEIIRNVVPLQIK